MTDYNEIIGDELRKRRLIARLTAYELALRIGVTRSLVNYWETNKRTISAQHLMDCLKAMDVDVDEFFKAVKDRV